MVTTSISDLVRQARKKIGKNQKDFARYLGKDQSVVSRYERGQAMPPGDVIMHCMHILRADAGGKMEVDLDELLVRIRQRLSGPSQAQTRGLLFELLNILA